MTLDFSYNDFFYTFDNSNVEYLQDGRSGIPVPAFFNVFHSFSVAALNVGNFAAGPSNFSEEYPIFSVTIRSLIGLGIWQRILQD